MKTKQMMTTAAISLGMCFAATGVLTPRTANAFQYFADYGQMRGLVDRTQSDLRSALQLEPEGAKQHERYREAQKSLSDFDKRLSKSHFDKGELDKCIDRVKDVLDHNTLQATSRDALMHDIDDLRIARDRFQH